jgi:cytochrome d ubiquinol oxidase subunit I
VGRQPWIVYGLMKTSEATSPLASSQVWVTLIAFIALYSILGLANLILLAKLARKGPEPAMDTPPSAEVTV